MPANEYEEDIKSRFLLHLYLGFSARPGDTLNFAPDIEVDAQGFDSLRHASRTHPDISGCALVNLTKKHVKESACLLLLNLSLHQMVSVMKLKYSTRIKSLALLLIVTLCFALVACNRSDTTNSTQKNSVLKDYVKEPLNKAKQLSQEEDKRNQELQSQLNESLEDL